MHKWSHRTETKLAIMRLRKVTGSHSFIAFWATLNNISNLKYCYCGMSLVVVDVGNPEEVINRA